MATKKTIKRSLIILFLVSLVGVGLWFGGWLGASNTEIRHVVLISIDTCRSDYLSCYGYPRQTTPNIDRLAEESTLFTNAITPIPLTLPAHTSMLTGTIPPYHGKHENADTYINPANVTLAELLKAKGFSTGAFVSAFILNSRFGLNRGFDVYHDQFNATGQSERSAVETNQVAFQWLEKQKDNPFFLFLHYYDPHDAYDPPEPYASKFKEDLYAGEIAYTDHCIGQVINKLKALGLYESSLIVVTGDHGEMLGEHGEKTHMFFIYQSALKVPLLFKLPGRPVARKIEEVVGIIDIVPTVCDLLEIEHPAEIQGQSLIPCFSKKRPKPEDRALYCESLFPTNYEINSLLGLVTNRWKYIQTTRPELYDLEADPGESNNLADAQPHRARILKDRLAQMLEQTVRQGDVDKETPLDEESLKHLKSLGYVSVNNVKEDFSFDQSKDDPKDLAAFHDQFLIATDLLEQHKFKQVRAICETLMEQRPQFFELYDLLADATLKLKDYTQAISYAQKGLALKPDRFKIHHMLAMSYVNTGKPKEAAMHFERILELVPEDREDLIEHRIQTHNELGRLRTKQKQFHLAMVQLKKTLELNPKQPPMINALAWLLATCPDAQLRNPGAAVKLARQACAQTKFKQPFFMNTLAVSYAAMNNFSEAIKIEKDALAQARSNGDVDMIKKIQRQLGLFQNEITRTKN
jgi:arylsulfatase A-like enzyme/Flp pilus assembly protein TadD